MNTSAPPPARRPSHRSLRGFTLAELAVVAAAVAVVIGIGAVGVVEMTATQKRNASLALANLTLREQRALALERRTGRFVRPQTGGGLVTGTATITGSTCVEDTEDAVIATPGLEVGGATRVCFSRDGDSPAPAAQVLQFRVPGEAVSLATVAVYPAGVLAWTGVSFASSGLKADTNFSVERFAFDRNNAQLSQFQ